MTATTPALTVDSVDSAARAALATFRAYPAVNLTTQAVTASADGFKAIWQFEKENQFGRSVAGFVKDIFIACLLPLLSLLWLGITTAYRTLRKPETRAAVVARYQAVKAWAAPKFSYERGADA